MNGNTIVRISSTAIVGIGAAAGSFDHLHTVCLRANESWYMALIEPLTVDGMMLVATGAMIDDQRHGRKPRLMARVGFVTGIVASIAANIAAAQPTLMGRLVAAWPAVALLLVVGIIEKRGKVTGVVPSEVQPDMVSTEIPDAVPARRGRPMAETREMADRIWALNPTFTRGEVAARLGISDGRLREIMRMTTKV